MDSSKIYQSKLFVYTAVDIRDEFEEVYILMAIILRRCVTDF